MPAMISQQLIVPPSFKAKTNFFRRERLPKICDLIEQSFSACFLLTAGRCIWMRAAPVPAQLLFLLQRSNNQLQNKELTCINNPRVGWEGKKTLGLVLYSEPVPRCHRDHCTQDLWSCALCPRAWGRNMGPSWERCV